MRSRLFFGVSAAFMTVARLAFAQSGDGMAAGLIAGDYIRGSAGVAVPINPQGSLRDWSRGTSLNLAWENWQNGGGSGVGRLGVAINVSYSLLPLNESNFLSDFTPISGGAATSAAASRAGMFELATNFRFRIPAPLLMPTINLGLGFLNWRPSTIDYSGPTGTGTAKQRSRNGGELSIGGGVERHIVDRYGLFAEAMYSYGFTSLGQGSVTPGGVCSASSCDALKNTSVAVIRGGLSVRIRD